MKRAILLVFLAFLLVLPILGQDSVLKTNFYFPYFAYGGGFWTEVQITSITPLPGKATVSFFNKDGSAMDITTNLGSSPISLNLIKFGQASIETPKNKDNFVCGWLRVESDVRLTVRLIWHHPFGQQVMLPEWERAGVAIDSEFSNNSVDGINTGLAIINPTDKRLKVTAYLKDHNKRDGDGNPTVVETTEFLLEPRQQIVMGVNEFFIKYFAVNNTFKGTEEFIVSDPVDDKNNLNTFVIAVAVRFTVKWNGWFDFGFSPVRPLPYRDPKAMQASAWKLVYFLASDALEGQCQTVCTGFPCFPCHDPTYEKDFQLLASLTQRWYADETERMGIGRRTFDVWQTADGKPDVLLITGKKKKAEYKDITGMVNEIREHVSIEIPIAYAGIPYFGIFAGRGTLQGIFISAAFSNQMSFINSAKDIDNLQNWSGSNANIFRFTHELGHAFGIPWHRAYFETNSSGTCGYFWGIMNQSSDPQFPSDQGCVGVANQTFSIFPSANSFKDFGEFMEGNNSFPYQETDLLKNSSGSFLLRIQ